MQSSQVSEIEIEYEVEVVDNQETKEEGEEDVTFQFVSDIHLEFGCVNVLPKIPVNAPILCLLGDIGYPNSAVYRKYILDQAERFEHVIVIAGNHEYYCQDSYQKANEDIEALCSKRSNIHFLNKSTFEYGNVTFIGCTLWPNLPTKHLKLFAEGVNDYRKIYVETEEGKKELLTPEVTNQWHEEQVDWIIKTIEDIELKTPDRRVVVLTHHAPSSFDTLWPETRGQVIAKMQYDELEHLMKPPMLVWAFGHTHYNSDYVRGEGVRVMSNQCGYILHEKKPSEGYDPGKVVSIKETEELVARYLEEGEKEAAQQQWVWTCSIC